MVMGSVEALSCLACVLGSSIGTPTVISGAATMKTMSSTSITSTSGVTLMSAITLPPPPLRRVLRRWYPPLAPPAEAPILTPVRQAGAR